MEEYNNLIKKAINEDINPLEIFTEFYIQKNDMPKDLKFEIEIVDNIEKNSKDYFKKIKKDYDYISIQDYNGATLVPHTTNEPIMIFLSKERALNAKNNNYEIICTLFHELTHAADFHNYYSKYCGGNYDSGVDRDSQYGFLNWTEFHAKRISYLEYCKIINGDKITSKESLENILNVELPKKNNELDEYLINNECDLEDIIYNLMFYLGRYSVWEDWFPSEFENGKHFSVELKKYLPLIVELSDLLKNTRNSKNEYENIKKHINYFKGMYVNLLN